MARHDVEDEAARNRAVRARQILVRAANVDAVVAGERLDLRPLAGRLVAERASRDGPEGGETGPRG